MKKHIQIEQKSFLSFNIGKEQFAVPVNQVIEVLPGQNMTPIPKTADYIEGIINFRGEILSVINTTKKINLREHESSKFVIIVFTLKFEDKEVLLGATADKVKQVINILETDIKPVPDFGSYYNPEFLKGAIKKDDDFIMILDIEKVLSKEDVKIIQEVSEKTEQEKK